MVTWRLFNAGLEIPPSLFNGQALWLGVHVEGDTQEMTPRQQLLPAPYALYAKVAPWDGLADVPPDLADGDDDTRYSAGAGLSLVGTAFEISNTYRLPQVCGDGDIPEWNATGGTWDCGSDDVVFGSLTNIVFALGNWADGSAHSYQGGLHYAALYTTAFSQEQVEQNTAALLASDDRR